MTPDRKELLARARWMGANPTEAEKRLWTILHDRRRDAFLRSQGFRLLRFWNNQVLGEREAVAAAVFAALSSPHPAGRAAAGCPSPARGEGLEQTNG